jgi:hypothetical protein
MGHGEVDDGSSCSLRTVGGQHIDTEQWATPDEGALEGDRRVLYLARKQAVSLYLSGGPGSNDRAADLAWRKTGLLWGV